MKVRLLLQTHHRGNELLQTRYYVQLKKRWFSKWKSIDLDCPVIHSTGKINISYYDEYTVDKNKALGTYNRVKECIENKTIILKYVLDSRTIE